MTAKTENTLVRDGWKNGKPLYKIRRGQTEKLSVRCRLSGSRWIEFGEVTASGQLDWERAFNEHIDNCPKCQESLKARTTEWYVNRLYAGDMERAMKGERYQVKALNLEVQTFHWCDRGDGGHQCSPKCMTAKGPSCECRCQGKNHGGSNQ